MPRRIREREKVISRDIYPVAKGMILSLEMAEADNKKYDAISSYLTPPELGGPGPPLSCFEIRIKVIYIH